MKIANKWCQVTLSLLALLLPVVVSAAETTDVYVSGRDGYHTYRIPALVVSSKGTLLAFCEGRKTGRSDHGDIDLLVKRSRDGGRSWSAQKVVYEEGGAASVTIGNPCPVVDMKTGDIILSFCRDNKNVFVTRSSDDGRTWTKPRDITEQVKAPGWGWYATGPGVGIQLARGRFKGRLVIPCDHREKVDGKWTKFSHVLLSDDGGERWRLGGSVEKHTDECQVVERSDGSLLINMRNYWGREGGEKEKGNMRSVAASADGGKTWSDLRFDDRLIEPVCQAGFIRCTWPDVHGASYVLFSNPASQKKRHRMTVRLSSDEGASWQVSKLLHEGPAAYSSPAVLGDLKIACLYEAGERHAYERIVCSRFSLSWLTGGDKTCTPGFSIGACDWTIGKRATPDALATAREIGLDCIQVDFGSPGADPAVLPLFDPKLQKQYLQESKKTGVEIASLAMGVLNSIPLKSDPRTDRWLVKAIETAQALKVKLILLAFFGKGDLKNDPAGMQAVIEKLTKVAPQAEKAGVVFGIESWLSAAELQQMLRKIGSPAYRVYYDVGNTTKMGYDIFRELRSLGNKLICEVHAKDYKGSFGSGEIDFQHLRRVLDEIGYHGPIVIESVKLPLGRVKTVGKDGRFLRGLFPPALVR